MPLQGDPIVWDNRGVLNRATAHATVRHQCFVERTTVPGAPREPAA